MKPDVPTAMTRLITEARAAIPFSAVEGLVCTGECGACVLKLIEHLDAELEYWEHRLRQGAQPTLRELSDLAKVCESAHTAIHSRADCADRRRTTNSANDHGASRATANDEMSPRP